MNINIPIWGILAILNIIGLAYLYYKSLNREAMLDGWEGLGNILCFCLGAIISVVFWVTWIVRGLIK